MDNWDELIINTEFIKGIISKLLHKTAIEKAGYDIEFQLNELNLTNRDEKVHVHLSADMEVSTAEIEKSLKKIL